MRQFVMLLLLVLITDAISLNSPYLIDVEKNCDFYVSLSWRNNDLNTKGYCLYRGLSESQLTCYDTLNSPEQLRCADSSISIGVTSYYSIKAFSDNEISESSNIDSITMPAVWKKPGLIAKWDNSLKKVNLTYTDSSSEETGFALYRTKGNKICEVVYKRNSLLNGQITWNQDIVDSTIEKNQWIRFYLHQFNANKTISSDTVTLFSLNFEALIKTPEKYLVNEKAGFIGGMTIQYDGTCLYFGNTLILTEKNSPDSMYSIFDITNPYQIRFKGYGIDADIPLSRFGNGSFIYQIDDSVCIYESANIFENDLKFVKFTNEHFAKMDTLKVPHLAQGVSGWVSIASGHLVYVSRYSSMIYGHTTRYYSEINSDSIRIKVIDSYRKNPDQIAIYPDLCFKQYIIGNNYEYDVINLKDSLVFSSI